MNTVFKDEPIIKYFSSIEQPYVYTFFNERFFKNWSLKIDFNNFSFKIKNYIHFEKQCVYLVYMYMNNRVVKLIGKKNINTILDDYKTLPIEIVYLKNKNISKYFSNILIESNLQYSQLLNALMIKNIHDELKIINSNFEETTFKGSNIITLN